MKFKTLTDMDFNGKKVLLRTDLDVPLDESLNITDDTRLRNAIPTINKLLELDARQVIIMGHLHRPGGKVVEELRMNPVGKRFSELLEQDVTKLDDCVDIEIPDSRIVLLENLRFHPEEKENYEFFAKKLASCADIFVMDAFANSHRDHASMTGVLEYLPSCAGLLFEKEISMLSKLIEKPEHPFIAIIGGAKITTKINVINNLIQKVDKLLLGGAMIFTFYKAQGLEIGKSLYEEEQVKLAGLLLHNEKIVLPKDVVIAPDKETGSNHQIVAIDKIPDDMYGLDIGPETISEFREILKDAKTVVWNGPWDIRDR